MREIRVAVLGAGGWGTALALVLARNPTHVVRLWSARPEPAAEMMARRENVRFLPGVAIPESIALTTHIDEAVRDVDLLIEAIPTIYLRDTMNRIAGQLPPLVPIVSVMTCLLLMALGFAFRE